MSCAPECYQRVIQQVLEGCEGTHNISDDIIVYGKSQTEHDERLHRVLQRIKSRGLTLNGNKCAFSMDRLVFMGHVLSEKGIGPAAAKAEAIVKARKCRGSSKFSWISKLLCTICSELSY